MELLPLYTLAYLLMHQMEQYALSCQDYLYNCIYILQLCGFLYCAQILDINLCSYLAFDDDVCAPHSPLQ